MHKNTSRILASMLTAALGATAMAAAPQAAPQKPAATATVIASPTARVLSGITVVPTEVNLTTSADFQTVIVQASYADGITEDITDKATYKIADATLVRRDKRELRPLKDGKTVMTVSYSGKTQQVAVTVADAAKTRPMSFRLDVMTAFTKAGCNSGDCHGSGRGKDGFMMSIFGYDPAGDYQRITREMVGRRVNLAVPRDSLLLTKSTGKVQHTGGELFKEDSELYNTVLTWLQAGAPDDSPNVSTVTGIEIMPSSAVLNGPGATQGFTVRAKYSDGTDRDVTRLAKFFTNNDRSATATDDGTLTAGERGEVFVMARFDAYTVGSPVIVLPKDLKFEFPKVAENNYIDTHVNNKLRKLRIIPADTCSDEQFLRRVHLDLIGMAPTRAEYDAFLADKSPAKREKVVDALLQRKEFVDMWVMKWAELLQIRSDNNIGRGISYKGAMLYHNWLTEKISDNVGVDKMVQELVGSSGSSFSNPAVNFYQVERDNLKLAENVAQVFMGFRLQCAQCHNHPFDRWTMDDYYGWAAFFTQVGRKASEDPRDQIVFDRGGNPGARHPVGGRDVRPKFLGAEQPDIQGKDRRKVLATWMASPRNAFFADNVANIAWAHFFGKGIIEPVDDVRVSNPAANRELLQTLGQKFTEYNYDFRKLIRDICTSRTYQLSTRSNPTNELDEKNFSRAYVRRMRAEVVYDVISDVTETLGENKFRSLPRGARAVQIADGRTSSYFLTTFGRATRETVCSCEVKMEPNLSQALHLLNGDTVNQKVRSGGVVARMLQQKMHPLAIVEDLYVRALSRKPNEAEVANIERVVAETGNNPAQTQQALEDVFWAVLNSKEFMFNH